jgi:predicted nucleic acid-binding protein
VTGRSFVDTNVLVYAADTRDQLKHETAVRLLAADGADFVLSAQVLGEFYVTVTRKLAVPMTVDAAAAAVSRLARLPVVAMDDALVAAAIGTTVSAQLSYWDALIIEAAARSSCTRVLTEDLNTGSVIRGVEVVNPFA